MDPSIVYVLALLSGMIVGAIIPIVTLVVLSR